MATPAQVWGFIVGSDATSGVVSAATLLVDELHLVHGLDASATLVVTDASRDAGPTVNQSLDATGGVVTATRL